MGKYRKWNLILGLETDLILLLILFLLFLFVLFGRPLRLRRFKSDGVKFCRIFLQVNNWWSRISDLTPHFEDDGRDVISRRKCCCMVNPHTASAHSASTAASANSGFIVHSYLDQEPISYRYSLCCCCCCSCCSCWGDRVQKSLGIRRFKSDRYEIWQDCFSHRLMYSDFDMTSFVQDGCHDVISRRKVLPSAVAIWWVHMQFLPRAYAAASASSWSIVHS